MSLLSENLKYLLKRDKMTVVHLAKASGLSRAIINRYLSDLAVPEDDSLGKLSKVFKVAPVQLKSTRLDPVRDISQVALGERLRRLRVAKGMAKTELAQKCGIDRTTIWQIEAGNLVPKDETLAKIASGLGVDVSVLMGSESFVAKTDLKISQEHQEFLQMVLARKGLYQVLKLLLELKPDYLDALVSQLLPKSVRPSSGELVQLSHHRQSKKIARKKE